MFKRKSAIALIAIGCLFLIAALALGGYNLWDNHRAQNSVDLVLKQLNSIQEASATAKPDTPTTNAPNPGFSSPHSPIPDAPNPGSPIPDPSIPDVPIPDYILNPYMTMPTVEIDGYRYIGKVSIPVLELELPVMDTWDYKRLKIAPCRYTGTAYLPGFVICAHNYTSHFGRLKNLSQGDTVIFTDMAGNEFQYEVAEVQTLAPTAVEEMKSDDWDLTLFTCTIGGRTRVTVRCRRAQT